MTRRAVSHTSAEVRQGKSRVKILLILLETRLSQSQTRVTLVSMLQRGWCQFKCCPCSLSYLAHPNLDQTCLIFLLVSGQTNRTVRCQNHFWEIWDVLTKQCVVGACPNSMLLKFDLILHICCIVRCFVISISLSQTYHYCVLCKLTGECYKNTDKHMGIVTKKLSDGHTIAQRQWCVFAALSVK